MNTDANLGAVIGPFGTGAGFRNPAKQLASMWRDVLFNEAEFKRAFSNIVFAVENPASGETSSQPSDFETFQKEFAPSNVFKTTAYR